MDQHYPFDHIEEVVNRVPDFYFKSEGRDGIDYNWFLSAPKYSTFRVNTSKFNSDEVVRTISQQIRETQLNCEDTISIKVHPLLPDCIIIGFYNNDSEIYNVECDAEVIVDIPCAQAVLRGADVFAPGILGLKANLKEGDLVKILADLERKCRRGFNKPFDGKTYLVGIGILKMNRNDLFKHDVSPKGVGVQVTWNRSGIPKISLPRNVGILQNLPSIVCGHLFSHISGSVLDMCAAPGNKTTHIASILGNKGHVTALDKTPGKVESITSLCSEMGLTNVTCFSYDSTKCIQPILLEKKITKPPFPPLSFSAILLDPPCSALGQRPILHNSISPSQLKSYVILQRRFLKSAVEGLMPGGMLVYSTCTITLEENEEMVSWALKEFPNLILQKINPELGKPGVNSSLSKEDCLKVSRFGHPEASTADEDTIGFFIAKFIKLK